MEDAFQRASFYVSVYILLRSLADCEKVPEEVEEFLDAVGVEVPEPNAELARLIQTLAASNVRTDLPPSSRKQLPHHIKAFMTQAGYESSEPVDSILTMTAFAARLAIDAYIKQLTDDREAERIERLLIRFLNTHLLPTLKHANSALTETLTQTISEDAQHLAQKFIKIDN